MPVRFSCMTVESSPSAWSAFKNRACTRRKYTKLAAISKGKKHEESAVILPLMGSMMAKAVTAMHTVRTTCTSCICTKRRTVSTSLVQRCTKSPVCTFL